MCYVYVLYVIMSLLSKMNEHTLYILTSSHMHCSAAKITQH